MSKRRSRAPWALSVYPSVALLTLLLAGSAFCDTPSQFSIMLSSGSVGRYEKLEIICNGITTSYSNPFDPNQVSVEGYFTDPDGVQEEVNGFWYEEYVRSLAGGHEVVTASGSPHWRVRYAPKKVGSYSCYVTVTDAGGTVQSETRQFTVAGSDNPGFLHVSEENPRYFEFDSGEGFFGVALNAGWWGSTKTYSYDDYFGKMLQYKANLARMYVMNCQDGDHPEGYIEWVLTIQDRDLGSNYDMADAWRFDYLLELAEQNGIYIHLTTEEFVSGFTHIWQANLYNSANGGTCTYVGDFFADPTAKQYHKRMLRYLVARYGYSTSIAIWDLTHEVNELQWQPGSWSWTDLYDWHQEMAAAIRQYDPYDHIIGTNTGSFNVFPDLYGLPEMEFGAIHSYYVPGWQDRPSDPLGQDMAALIDYYSSALRRTVPNKPNINAGFGVLASNWGISEYTDGTAPDDFDGINLHNGLWSGLMSGLAATPYIWQWSYCFAHPAWLEHYTGMANFMAGEDLVSADLAPISSQPILNNGDFEQGDEGWTLREKFSISSDPRDAQGHSLRWTSTESEAMRSNSWAYVRANTQYTLTAWVKTVGVSSTVDGIYLLAQYYDGSEWIMHRSAVLTGDTEQELSITFTTGPAIAAGKLYIDCSAHWSTGTAWFDDVRLEETAVGTISVSDDNLRVLGLKNRDGGLFWLKNKEHTWYNVVAQGMTPQTIQDATFTISSMNEGNYTIESWDTYDGIRTETVTAATDGSGNLTVSLAGIQKDIGYKINRQVSGEDTIPPSTPVIATPAQVVNAETIEIALSVPSTDANFSNHQLRGGQYLNWTDTSGTGPFVFALEENTVNTLSVRGRDTYGNVSDAASVAITEDSQAPSVPPAPTHVE